MGMHSKVGRVRKLFAKVICILIIIVQGVILDYYSYDYFKTATTWLFSLLDLANVILFCATFYVVYNHIKYCKNKNVDDLHFWQSGKVFGLLPLGYIAWFVYALSLVPRIAIVFKHHAPALEESNFFGPNLIKTATALVAVVFLLVIRGHYEHKIHKNDKHYTERLIGIIPIDLLDGVEFMELMFEEESRENISDSLENAIIAFPCINLVLTGISLLVLSYTQKKYKKISSNMKITYAVLHIVLVNGPYLAIRMYLWHTLNLDVSVLLVKNIIVLVLDTGDIYDEIHEMYIERRKEKKAELQEVAVEDGHAQSALNPTFSIHVDRNGHDIEDNHNGIDTVTVENNGSGPQSSNGDTNGNGPHAGNGNTNGQHSTQL